MSTFNSQKLKRDSQISSEFPFNLRILWNTIFLYCLDLDVGVRVFVYEVNMPPHITICSLFALNGFKGFVWRFLFEERVIFSFIKPRESS